jgi:hypothetical protein
LLPKPLRDTLLLEAVSILSEEPRPRTRRPHTVNNTTQMRFWNDTPEGHNAMLAAAGRHYRINKDKPSTFRGGGGIGKVWKLLIECKNDHITYEGLTSIAKGQKLAPAATVSALWSKGMIDVIESEKKVATAY